MLGGHKVEFLLTTLHSLEGALIVTTYVIIKTTLTATELNLPEHGLVHMNRTSSSIRWEIIARFYWLYWKKKNAPIQIQIWQTGTWHKHKMCQCTNTVIMWMCNGKGGGNHKLIMMKYDTYLTQLMLAARFILHSIKIFSSQIKSRLNKILRALFSALSPPWYPSPCESPSLMAASGLLTLPL